MLFQVIARRELWRGLNTIIRLQDIVKFCESVWSRFELKTDFDFFYFSLNNTMKTWNEYKIYWEIPK